MANWFTRGVRRAAEWVSRSLEDPAQPVTADILASEATGSYTGDTGSTVTASKVLGYAPLNQAVSMISGDCAKLPLNVYQKTRSGRQIADGHPVQKVIHRYSMANEEVNGYKFWRRYFTSALIWGNAYAWIDRNNRGEVIGLYQLLPDRTWMARINGKLQCVTQSRKGTRIFAASDVLHLEGLSIDGVQGANTIRLFREDFAIALAAKQFEARFFRNNMNAGGILQVKPGTSAKAVTKARKQIEERFTGSDNAFKTLVIRDNMQWVSTQVDPQKAQLLELDENQVREVARMYNIQPSRLGLKDSISFNSEEAAKGNYHDGALSHWLIGNCAECTTKLLTEEERAAGMYIENNVNALLWADAATRNTIAITGIQAGRFSANETRGWENLDSYEGGDTYYYPLNLSPVGETDSAETDRNEIYRSLLEEAFARAINRACIRVDRGKPLEDDRENIVGIIDSTLRNVAALVGTECTDRANAWFDSLLGVDAASLRGHAEASSLLLIDKLLERGDDDAVAT